MENKNVYEDIENINDKKTYPPKCAIQKSGLSFSNYIIQIPTKKNFSYINIFDPQKFGFFW